MQMPNQFIHNMKWGGVKSILTLLLGLFLLVAAALKIHGLIVDPYAHDNFLSAPWLQVLTIEVEVLLGLWLLSKLQQQLAWYATLLFFVALSIISFLLATQGQSSCGCFGKVEVNPWYTFALDVSIVLLMVLVSLRTYVPLSFDGRGVRGDGEATATRFSSILHMALITTVILGTIALGFTLYSSDPWAELGRLRGESLSILPSLIDVGSGHTNEIRKINVTIRNNTNKSIRLYGGTSNCSCVTTSGLPVDVAPLGHLDLVVYFKFTGAIGITRRQYFLYSNSPERLTKGHFIARIVTYNDKSDLDAYQFSVSDP